MKIIADKNMPLVAETFGCHGDVLFLNGREICTDDLADAEVLLVRSVTRVDESLLSGTGIRFVGSATIGIDHMDTGWLEANNISWAHAPGCNADSAAQYALAMMWLACERLQLDLEQQTVGIIGRGNVGRRLEQLLQALDIPVVACDPPLMDQGSDGLVSMQEACASSIVSLHVPLTGTGRHPTTGLFGMRQLQQLSPGTLLVNTSRGGVVDRTPLLALIHSGHLHAALDVWPDEPVIDLELLQAVTVATPHVAGYSLEGKQAGTNMIYKTFCQNSSVQVTGSPNSDNGRIKLRFDSSARIGQVLQHALQSSCPVARDDATLRTASPLGDGVKHVNIDSIRANYPQRREFKSHHLGVESGIMAKKLKQLGFRISTSN